MEKTLVSVNASGKTNYYFTAPNRTKTILVNHRTFQPF